MPRIPRRKHTNFNNEITGEYYKQPFFDGFDKKVAIAVGVMVVACSLILLVMFVNK